MNQRQAIVLAMRVRPGWLPRRKASDLACAVHGFFSLNLWRIKNPRMAWFSFRVTAHFRYGFPMPAMPPHSIEA